MGPDVCTDRTGIDRHMSSPKLFHRHRVNRPFLTPSTACIVMSPMKNRSLLPGTLVGSIVTVLAVASIGAQASAPTIIGRWRADTPLPNGIVQTFRFDPDGRFDLAMALAVDGTYRVDGNQLIETVTLPSVGVTHTDTATFSIDRDSLLVHEHGGTPAHALHRSVPSTTKSIVGEWEISVGGGTAAHYVFESNGTMRVRAQVGDEQGKYEIRADTLHLSNSQTFQLPAIAQFVVADSVLTLTPANGKAARRFHKVAPE